MDSIMTGRHVTPSKHPYYFAGLYYLQEPSAMTPANRLPVEPGDKVLDVCAAPEERLRSLEQSFRGKEYLRPMILVIPEPRDF